MEAFSNSLVSAIRSLIGGIEIYLAPLALTTGLVLTLTLLFLGPGVAMHIVSRIMSRGTEKTFGRFDALLTMVLVACCMGCVWGVILAGAFPQGHASLLVAMTTGLTVGIGLATGSWSVLKARSTMVVTLLYAGSGAASWLYMLMQ